MKTLAIAVVLSLGFLVNASAQTAASATANHNVTVALTNAIELTFTAGGTGATLTFATPDDYTNGVVAAGAATLQVRSNKAYTVAVKAAAANFTSTSTTTMPVAGVLSVKKSTDANYVGITASDAALTTGARGTASFNVDYKATPGFAYDGGSYVANIVYTATQQ